MGKLIARRFLLAGLFTILGPALNTGFAAVLQSESFCGTSQSDIGGVAGMTPAIGQKKLLTILVNFAEDPTDRVEGNLAGQNYISIENTADAQQLLFDDPSHLTVKDWFTEASYGQMQLTGDVAGYFTLNIPIAPLSDFNFQSAVATQARAAATNAGFNLANYNFVLYALALPSAISGSAGLASNNQMWTAGLSFNVVVHELGHCLGIKHANAWNCGNTIWQTENQCTLQEYGDPYDCMGNGGAGHYNSHFKYSLGWLTEEQITTVTQNGVFTLTPLETSGGIKALKIPHYQGRDLFVEFRQLIGFDQIAAAKYGSNFASDGFDGLIAYRFPVPISLATPYGETGLLDMTPNSNLDPERPDLDIVDCTLRAGMSFVDALSRIRVKTLSVTGTGNNALLTVEVTFSNLHVNLGPDAVIPFGSYTVFHPVITGGTPPYSCSWSPTVGLGDGCEPTFVSGTFVPQGITYTLSVTDSSPDPVPAGDQIRVFVTQLDCNHNSIADSIDLLFGISTDLNANSVPDECEINVDCNQNGILDYLDLFSGTSHDCNGNSILDDCEAELDCNQNSISDDCDIAIGSSQDCNENAIPDECELDCNGNGVADNCDLLSGTSNNCNSNGIPDECENLSDCDSNGIPDFCEIHSGTTPDCNHDEIPDVCEVQSPQYDCNQNGIPDDCDTAPGGGIPDCNHNDIPDSCDIRSGYSKDCNRNLIPDECQVFADCNENGSPDDCDIRMEISQDCNDSNIPDECEIQHDQLVYNWTNVLGGMFEDTANSVLVDHSGNIWITGEYSGNVDFDPGAGQHMHTSIGNQDIFLEKFAPDGSYVWSASLGSNGTNEKGCDLAVDSTGAIYWLGRFYGTVDFDPGDGVDSQNAGFNTKFFVTKFHSDGSYAWTKTFGASHPAVQKQSLAIDSFDNLFIAGIFESADFDPGPGVDIKSGSNDSFITKLDNQGNYAWTKVIGGTGEATIFDITIDVEGSILVTGSFLGTVDFDPSTGVDSRQSLLSFSPEAFITKLDNNGIYAWTKIFRGYAASAVVTDSEKNIFVGGYFPFNYGSVDFDPSAQEIDPHVSNGLWDVFLSKFSSNGNFIWAKTFGGVGNDRFHSITLDPEQNLLCAGSFQNNVDFDPGIGEELHHSVSNGDPDVWISKFDREGNHAWARTFGGVSHDVPNCIQVTADREIFIAGYFNTFSINHTVDFDFTMEGSDIQHGHGSKDVFLLSFFMNPGLPDCNHNLVLDECELDCNGDGIPNACDNKPCNFICDLDQDGKADEQDLAIMQNCLAGGKTPQQVICATADLNGDGRVDTKDWTLFETCYVKNAKVDSKDRTMPDREKTEREKR